MTITTRLIAHAEPTWFDTALAPEGVTVMTKIDDEKGVRNEQPLKRRGNLWFFPDDGMYVYYRPTHFLLPTAPKEPRQ